MGQKEFKNRVFLEGVIKHINGSAEKGVIGIELATFGKYKNYPTVLCFEEKMDEVLQYSPGDWVKISGVIETHFKRVANEDGTYRNEYLQGIVLTDIEPSISIDQEHFEGTTEYNLHKSENLVALTGTVNSVKPYEGNDNNNRVQMTLYCMNGAKKNIIMLTVYCEDAEKFAAEYEKGDWVDVLARVQTVSKYESRFNQKVEKLVSWRVDKIDSTKGESDAD